MTLTSRRPRRRVGHERLGGALVLMLALAVSLAPGTAQAAPVEKEVDSGRGFSCFLPSEPGYEVIIGVHDGAVAGQTAFIDLIGPGYREEALGTSTWTDSTFSADITLQGPDGFMHVEGTYAPAGPEEQRHGVDRFGNSTLVGRSTTTPIAVEFTEIQVGEIRFDLEHAGDVCDGAFFDIRSLSNAPATSVSRESTFVTEECLAEDGARVEVFRDGRHSEITVRGEELRGSAEVSPDGTMQWTDRFTGEPVGTTPLSAALSRAGAPFVVNELDGTVRMRTQVTPMRFTMSTTYPDGRPVTVSCEAAQLRITFLQRGV